MNHPTVSIALATYNGSKYLRDFLQSLRQQTWTNLEVVASDDASTDSSVGILREFQDVLTLKLITNDERRGIVPNFNCALSACGADYIALADQDDVWLPQKVAALMERLLEIEHRQGRQLPALVFSNLEIVDERMEAITPFLFLNSAAKAECRQHVADLLLRNHVPGCAILFNRALLERAMPIPDGFFMHDWWLMLVAASFGTIKAVDLALLRYRQHANNAEGFQTVRPASGISALSPAVWRRFFQKSRFRAGVVSKNLSLFEERFDPVLPARARAEIAFFKGSFRNPFIRLRYLSVTGTGFNVWVLLSMCS